MEIDYTNITSYGAKVLQTFGELDFPKIKRPLSHDWDDENGLDIDLSTNTEESRIIAFEMLFSAVDMATLETNIFNFSDFISLPGLHVVKFDYIDTPLFLILEGSIEVERLNGKDESPVYARVNFDMLEPFSTGRYFEFESDSNGVASFVITCTDLITVDWGDGTTEDVLGTTITVEHTYDSTYEQAYVGVLGNINSISALTNLVALTEIV